METPQSQSHTPTLSISYLNKGHITSKGVPFTLDLHCDELKGEKVVIQRDASKLNGIESTFVLLVYLCCMRSDDDSEQVMLDECCNMCTEKSLIGFKNNHVVFSPSGEAKLSVKIRGVPTHNGRPRSTVFVLKIEIKNNSTSIKGEIAIPFKKHYRAKRQPDPSPVILDEEELSILNNTLLPLQQAIEYMSNKPAFNSTKRKFSQAVSQLQSFISKNKCNQNQQTLSTTTTDPSDSQNDNNSQQQQQQRPLSPSFEFSNTSLDFPTSLENSQNPSSIFEPLQTFFDDFVPTFD